MRWKKRWFSVILAAFAALFALTACTRFAVHDYFLHTEQCFRAEVRGTLCGEDFCAVVEGDFDNMGARVCKISYLSPDHLAGMSIEAFSNGTATVSFDGVAVSVSRDSVEGLLLPIDLLLLEGEVETVRRNGACTILTLPDDVTLTLSDAHPIAVAAPTVSFSVVWFEAGSGGKG